MKDNGSTGPTSKQYLTEVMMPSMYKGENMTNASVIHCLGVDTEETVIESAQYAAPELVIPIEPPKRIAQREEVTTSANDTVCNRGQHHD